MTTSQRHVNMEKLIVIALATELSVRGFPDRFVCFGVGGRQALRLRGIAIPRSALGPRPDVWVIDGEQLYAVEVGRTNPDKWRMAFPIVHVSFGGSVAIYGALFTPFERALVDSLTAITALDRALDEEQITEGEAK
jgi:hypothetical protein